MSVVTVWLFVIFTRGAAPVVLDDLPDFMSCQNLHDRMLTELPPNAVVSQCLERKRLK